ncbi:MAG: ATP synthase subunit I [Desulfomonilaceae bacterium]|nr:ATP synthase subunit I [Desulfomonilaceae bacterium]
MKFEKIPGVLFILSAGVYILGLPACFILASPGFALGFGAGGALVLLNAWASSRRVRKADFPHRGVAMASILGNFYLRLLLIGIFLFGFIRYVKVDPIGLVTGLSVVPAGLLVLLILIFIANRRPEEV